MGNIVPDRNTNRSVKPKNICENCDEGNEATHTVVTNKGFLNLCEKCYND
jgi:hypothetical protein